MIVVLLAWMNDQNYYLITTATALLISVLTFKEREGERGPRERERESLTETVFYSLKW